jgi:hypothetical protein
LGLHAREDVYPKIYEWLQAHVKEAQLWLISYVVLEARTPLYFLVGAMMAYSKFGE